LPLRRPRNIITGCRRPKRMPKSAFLTNDQDGVPRLSGGAYGPPAERSARVE
jgi:hypothetical protein